MVAMRRAGALCVVALGPLWLTGCGRPLNAEQLAKEVLQKDPEFSWVLEKHESLANRIKTYERELALKRSTVEQNIAQLRKDLATATTSVKAKIADTRKLLEPEHERLKLALSMASEELSNRRFQRASLGRSIVKLRKAGKSAAATWTAEERNRQQAQLNELQRDAKRLDQEIDGIKAHLRLLKTKLLLIKL